MDRRDEVVLITGASSGLGQACARRLARRGYRVFGTSRRPEAGASEPFTMIQMDVSDEESVRQGVAAVLAQAGRLDVLVNNAGFGFGGAVEDTSVHEARATLEVNLLGPLRLCQAVLPVMRAQGCGRIVNIASIGGLVALPFQGLYSASKFALEGLSEALRMEVRPFGIHVVLIEPGDIRTNFTTHRRRTRASLENPAYRDKFKRALAVARLDERHGASAEQVAAVVERVIRRRSPRLRYRAGNTFEKLAATVKRIVPEKLFEWGVMKYYRVG